MRHPLEPRKSLWLPALAALMAASLSAIIAAELTQGSIMVAWYNDQSTPVSLVRVFNWLGQFAVGVSHGIPFNIIHPEWFVAAMISAMKDKLDNVDLARRFVFDIELSTFSALVAGIVALAVTLYFEPRRPRIRHVSGRELLAGVSVRRFVKRSERAAKTATGAGLEIAPGLVMSRQRETSHFLVTGSSGSGKTVFFRHLLRQILQRGDRTLVHDSKGDMVESFPIENFLLLAPHDRRSAIWDIGRDVRSAQDARELAAAFIPESKDPIWSSGARELLTGVIVALQKTARTAWGWSELKTLAMMDIRKLRQLLAQHYPEAVGYLEFDNLGQPTKIALSFYVTTCAHLAGTLIPLARAWPDDSDAPRFSIRTWVRKNSSKNRVVIMQRAPHLPELSSTWIRAFVQNFSNIVVGPLLADDRERRIWLALDEFAQLRKVDGFQQILEAGRSKGLCVVLGIQDPHQLADIYGADAAKTWQSTFSTKLIFRMTASTSANMICNELIGKRRVAWVVRNKSIAPWKLDGSGEGTTLLRQTDSQEIDVVTPAYLENSLGWTRSWPTPVIRGLVLGFGFGHASAVLQTEWPIEPWPARRPATIPAEWVKR